jgi:hypothetical protein
LWDQVMWPSERSQLDGQDLVKRGRSRDQLHPDVAPASRIGDLDFA